MDTAFAMHILLLENSTALFDGSERRRLASHHSNGTSSKRPSPAPQSTTPPASPSPSRVGADGESPEPVHLHHPPPSPDMASSTESPFVQFQDTSLGNGRPSSLPQAAGSTPITTGRQQSWRASSSGAPGSMPTYVSLTPREAAAGPPPPIHNPDAELHAQPPPHHLELSSDQISIFVYGTVPMSNESQRLHVVPSSDVADGILSQLVVSTTFVVNMSVINAVSEKSPVSSYRLGVAIVFTSFASANNTPDSNVNLLLHSFGYLEHKLHLALSAARVEASAAMERAYAEHPPPAFNGRAPMHRFKRFELQSAHALLHCEDMLSRSIFYFLRPQALSVPHWALSEDTLSSVREALHKAKASSLEDRIVASLRMVYKHSRTLLDSVVTALLSYSYGVPIGSQNALRCVIVNPFHDHLLMKAYLHICAHFFRMPSMWTPFDSATGDVNATNITFKHRASGAWNFNPAWSPATWEGTGPSAVPGSHDATTKIPPFARSYAALVPEIAAPFQVIALPQSRDWSNLSTSQRIDKVMHMDVDDGRSNSYIVVDLSERHCYMACRGPRCNTGALGYTAHTVYESNRIGSHVVAESMKLIDRNVPGTDVLQYVDAAIHEVIDQATALAGLVEDTYRKTGQKVGVSLIARTMALDKSDVYALWTLASVMKYGDFCNNPIQDKVAMGR